MLNQNFKVTPDLYASRGSRFSNYIIDLLVIVGVLMGLFIGFVYLYYKFSTDTAVMDNFLDETEDINSISDRLITAIVLFVSYFLMESLLKGKSIGKYVTKTRVVMEDGSNPMYLDYLKRSACRIIPFDALSFLGSSGRGWHDSISKTYVVDEQKFNSKKETINDLDQIGKTEED